MDRFRSVSVRPVRASVAALLLMSFLASSFEAVAGLVRDGAVHHETVAEALSHSSDGTGEHGHEAASEAPDEEHGPDHQHGAGADHCTHAHGTALAPAAVAALYAEVDVRATTPASAPSDYRAPPLFHPPRA